MNAERHIFIFDTRRSSGLEYLIVISVYLSNCKYSRGTHEVDKACAEFLCHVSEWVSYTLCVFLV